MNDNAKKLIKALRSGKYSQAIRQLRKKNGFCCLGVACDIYSKETGSGKWYNNSFLDHLQTLPLVVMEWFGFKNNAGSYDDAKTLTELNDSGVSFKKIADIIESEPEGLFTKTE